MYTSVTQGNTVRTHSTFFLKPQIQKKKRKSLWFGVGVSGHQRGAARGQVQCLSFWKARWDDVIAARPSRQLLYCPCHPTRKQRCNSLWGMCNVKWWKKCVDLFLHKGEWKSKGKKRQKQNITGFLRGKKQSEELPTALVGMSKCTRAPLLSAPP